MTIYILPILILDILLLLWIMGHMPRHLQFPEINISVLLIIPFIIGLVIYFDLKRSFGLFDNSETPLYQHIELYFLYSLVFLGFYSAVALTIRYHENLPRSSVYYQGITNNIKKLHWLPMLFHLLLICSSILGILRFYIDYEIYM